MTVPRAWILVGHYFRILALMSILSMIASLIQAKGFRIDFTFLVLFWIALGLEEGQKVPRIAAIVVCALFVTAAVGSLGYAAVATRPRSTMLWETLSCALFLLFFLPPLTLLLRPSLVGPSAAAPEEEPTKPRRPFGIYLLAALFLGIFPTALELAAGRITLTSSTGMFAYGESRYGRSVVMTAQEEPGTGPARTLFISYWVIGDSSSGGTSTFHPSSVTVGDRTVLSPDVTPLRYVSRLETVHEPVDHPNVLIVRADGRVIPLQRRVRIHTLLTALQAIEGCRDFDEIQRKLESLLPEAKKPYPSGLY